jgi:ribosome biogenesis GTPase
MPQGRIIKGLGGLYEVASSDGHYFCPAKGLFRLHKITPIIGDICDFNITSEGEGVIRKIHKRKNELRRPPVANIDQIIVVCAVYPKIDRILLDKYLVVLEHNELEIIICINKSDLSDDSIWTIKNIYENVGYRVLTTSASTGAGEAYLREILRDKASAFAGVSGVGKSSLINILMGGQFMETGALSGNKRGKHTTRHVQFLELDSSTFILDTPGFSNISTDNIDKEDLQHLFPELVPFFGKCAFRNCHHISEPDCAVRENVGRVIDEIRYENYVTMYFS